MYVVLEIQKNKDNKIGTLVYSYDGRFEAESKYHAILASAALSSLPLHSAVLLSEDGTPLMNYYYTHEQEIQE